MPDIGFLLLPYSSEMPHSSYPRLGQVLLLHRFRLRKVILLFLTRIWRICGRHDPICTFLLALLGRSSNPCLLVRSTCRSHQ